jgi:hypothetical protein
MSSVVIAGDTSGTVTISAPAVAGTPTLTLPTTSGTILTSGTAVTVAQGGTGNATATAYAVQCGGTTSTGAHQSIASVGTSGQVLTSNGASALPTFQTISSGATTLKIVTDTTDIAVTALPSAGYSTIGSTFSVSIPTTGCIAIRNIVMKITNNQANYSSPVLGLRIGSTNYWLNANSGSGVTNYEGAFITVGSTLNYITIIYNGVMSAGPGGNSQFGFNQLIDIVASSIPTGTQTVQLIVGKSTSFTTNFTIGGSTVTTRVGVEFVSAS